MRWQSSGVIRLYHPEIARKGKEQGQQKASAELNGRSEADRSRERLSRSLRHTLTWSAPGLVVMEW